MRESKLVAGVSLHFRPDGVAVGVIRGLVTKASLISLLEKTQREFAAAKPSAWVSDYRRAVLAVDLCSVAGLVSGDSALAIPAALVVGQPHIDMARDYAWQLAQRGLLRKVFTSPDRALEWAILEARPSYRQTAP